MVILESNANPLEKYSPAKKSNNINRNQFNYCTGHPSIQLLVGVILVIKRDRSNLRINM